MSVSQPFQLLIDTAVTASTVELRHTNVFYPNPSATQVSLLTTCSTNATLRIYYVRPDGTWVQRADMYNVVANAPLETVFQFNIGPIGVGITPVSSGGSVRVEARYAPDSSGNTQGPAGPEGPAGPGLYYLSTLFV